MNNFKKVLLHSLLLILFVVILLVLFMVPYFHGEYYFYQDYRVRQSLSGKLDTLIIGSSHASRSVKPTILNEELNINSYNISSPVMSMYGRYFMLEKEIKRNPIKTVFIEISFNALTLDRKKLGFEGDIYVLGRLDNTFERLEFFKNAFTVDEYKDIFSDTIRRSKVSLEKDMVNMFKSLKNGKKEPNQSIVQYETLGYLAVPSNNLSMTAEHKKKALNSTSIDIEIKEDNLEYFDAMMKLCQDNGIRVILIVTPVAERMILSNRNLDGLFSQYIELAHKYNCEYYDFNLDKKASELYFQKTSFYDNIHMSDQGAEIFSKRLAEIIKKVNDGEDCSKEFYNSYDEVKDYIMD